jgi:RND family efflux transporter MFP subunit
MNRLSWLLLILLPACGDKVVPLPQPPRVVLLHQVHLGAGANQAVYSGEVRPRHEAALGFRVGGKLIERRVDVGDRVAAGQVLARLDVADLAQAQQGVEAQLAAAQADLGLARAEAERYRSLFAQKFISQSALDVKEVALKGAEEKWRAATAQRAIARNQTGYAQLASDQAGVVSGVLAEVGQVLAAGQAVVKVARTDEKEVLIALPENRVAELAAAGDVVVTLWAAPDKRYRGRVREVSPQADPLTRTYAARVAILDADAGVRLGMTARVDLGAGGKTGKPGTATMIPAGSVFQQGKRAAVWVIGDDSRVHLRPVDVTAWRDDGVAISSGLAEGERIVAAGAHKLAEGEAVRLAETRP